MPLTALAALLAVGASGASLPACGDCSVVMIAVDTLRPDHLGCYGYARPTSPRIDEFAREATVFDQFIVQSYLTPISMASIFSSRYPTSSGYVSFVDRPERGAPWLPEILRHHGFETAAFLSSPEFYFTVRTDWGARLEPARTFSRGFVEYSHPRDSSAIDGARPPAFRDHPGEEAFEWLRRNKDRRFFVWIALGSAHWPYGLSAPERIKRLFVPSGYEGPLGRHSPHWWFPLSQIHGGALHPLPEIGPRGPAPWALPRALALDDRDRAWIIGHYDAGIRHTDEFVGRLWDELRRSGLGRRTIVLLLAEHAEDLGENGYYTHYDIRNTELRAPLIIRHPRLRGPGRVSELVSGLDVAPTLLELLGIPVFHQAQGRSLAPLLAGRTTDARRHVFSQRTPPWEMLQYQGQLAHAPAALRPWRERYLRRIEPLSREWTPARADVSVQDGRWKLIHRRSREQLARYSWWGYLTGRAPQLPEYELYDLRSDPLEKRELSRSEPAALEELKRVLAAFEAREDRRRASSRPSERRRFPYP